MLSTELPTVAEVAAQSRQSKIWLCPRLVEDGRISRPALLQGYDCTRSTIPDEVKDKKVVRHFVESNTECIIWENNEN